MKEASQQRIVEGILREDLGHQRQTDRVQHATASVLKQTNHSRQGFLFPPLDHGFAKGAFAVVKSCNSGVHETHAGTLALEELPDLRSIQPKVVDAHSRHGRARPLILFPLFECLPGKVYCHFLRRQLIGVLQMAAEPNILLTPLPLERLGDPQHRFAIPEAEATVADLPFGARGVDAGGL
eukprot:CAMPEP_0181428594 /NCGR_PEP_ID=MMETSP1110-20121109/16760_1 /TAXON_ID=174948 /ORGANISM="Symbiodinium sp., Strain CCMP421" /LENGTH=180 /DNA_ID=CAMNT_0023551827 /DNA_START=105 /DNA_END=647 /DNA_ORIENTATION=-